MAWFGLWISSKVSPDGSRIAVCDFGNCRIKVFDGSNGELMVVFGFRGTQRGQFQHPECLAVDDKGSFPITMQWYLSHYLLLLFCCWRLQGLFWSVTMAMEGFKFFDPMAILFVLSGAKDQVQDNLIGSLDWPFPKTWISLPPILRITAYRSFNWLPKRPLLSPTGTILLDSYYQHKRRIEEYSTIQWSVNLTLYELNPCAFIVVTMAFPCKRGGSLRIP